MTNTTQDTPNYIHDINKYANDSRIEAIQSYANEHGMALALSKMSRGLHGIGYPKAGRQQSKILDLAANTVIDYAENGI